MILRRSLQSSVATLLGHSPHIHLHTLLAYGLPDLLPPWPLRLLSSPHDENSCEIYLPSPTGNVNVFDLDKACLLPDLEDDK